MALRDFFAHPLRDAARPDPHLEGDTVYQPNVYTNFNGTFSYTDPWDNHVTISRLQVSILDAVWFGGHEHTNLVRNQLAGILYPSGKPLSASTRAAVSRSVARLVKAKLLKLDGKHSIRLTEEALRLMKWIESNREIVDHFLKVRRKR